MLCMYSDKVTRGRVARGQRKKKTRISTEAKTDLWCKRRASSFFFLPTRNDSDSWGPALRDRLLSLLSVGREANRHCKILQHGSAEDRGDAGQVFSLCRRIAGRSVEYGIGSRGIWSSPRPAVE